MGNSQRRFRRGWLQVQRHRTRAGSSRHGGISGSENAISCRQGLHRRNSITVPSLPKLGTPPAPAPLRKIALEEHFGHPIVFMRDSDGRFETRKEAAVGHLGPEYFALVQERLLDFDTTRLQAMDDAGVDKVLLSFGAG